MSTSLATKCCLLFVTISFICKYFVVTFCCHFMVNMEFVCGLCWKAKIDHISLEIKDNDELKREEEDDEELFEYTFELNYNSSIGLKVFVSQACWVFTWSFLLQCSLRLTRSSATVEKQRVSCPIGGGVSPPVHCPSPFWLHLCVRSNPKPATNVKRTLSWIGHSRSFKVILICADRNRERCVVVMSN